MTMFVGLMKKKKLWIAGYAVIVCVTGALVFFSTNGFVHLFKMKRELYELNKKNNELMRQNVQLLKNIQLFTSSRTLQEEAIRRELGWIKDGEIVIDFPRPHRDIQAITPDSLPPDH